MGVAAYEEAIITRAPSVLAPTDRVSREIARSMRSDLPGTVRLPAWVMQRAPRIARRAIGLGLYRGADVVHRMGLGMPPARVPEVITIHDTVAWRFDDESAPEPFVANELRRAAAVITPSQYSADDIREFLGVTDVEVIHNGVDEAFFDAAGLTAAQRAALKLPGPYVIHAGGASKRKNLEALAAAWPAVRAERPDLTLALSGPEHPRRTSLFAKLDGTRLLGRVDSGLLPALISSAAAVLVPSLHEGFGLPALEGMAAGVPVVAARTSSLVEVVDDAGFLIDPTPDALAEAIITAAAGGSEVDALVTHARARAAEFTWEASARKHAAVWRRAAERGM